MTDAARVTALVLAAGAGSRFGGGKMLAVVDGRVLPAHAIAAARAAGIRRVVVVCGRDAVPLRRALGAEGPHLCVLNPAPERGLASSLRAGVAAATAAPAPAGVLVLLGDQPFVRSDVIAALLAAPPGDAIAVAPRYEDDAAPNPVLLLPAGFSLAAAAEGDRGLGRLLASRGADVLRIPVGGRNPDIDTTADLAAARSDP